MAGDPKIEAPSRGMLLHTSDDFSILVPVLLRSGRQRGLSGMMPTAVEFDAHYNRASSPVRPKSVSLIQGQQFRFAQIVLKKSFRGDERKFLEPLMRLMRGNVRDHIVSSKIDHGPS